MQHLLRIADLSLAQIEALCALSHYFYAHHETHRAHHAGLLAHISGVMLFFEPSTRTKSAFAIAAKNLGVTLDSLAINASSTQKGEALLDTLHTLEAMGHRLFIVRHPTSGAPAFMAKYVSAPKSAPSAIINAGDGAHAHPTQALLDIATLKRHRADIDALSVAIVGDILHSRVARSHIQILRTLGVADIRLVGPKTLIPESFAEFGVSLHHRLKSGLMGADVVIALRLQKERMHSAYVASEHDFLQHFGITTKVLAWCASDALFMHPGPVNRGIEMSGAMIDHPNTLILEQVTMGVFLRMAVFCTLFGVLPEGFQAPQHA